MKFATAQEAVASVRSGDTVFIGTGAATPSLLVHALYARARTLHDVTLLHFITDGLLPRDDVLFVSPFVHHTLFVGSEMRRLLQRGGRVHYIPLSLAEVPRLVESGRLRADVALIQTSAVDERSCVHLGVGVDIAACMVRSARVVAAEVNARMPMSCGDTALPIARIDHAVASDLPLAEYVHPAADAVARQVARYIASLIEDGATLQIGVGQIPNEALRFLAGREHLAIHSDVITDSVLDLIDAGVVDGSRKSTDPGRIVTSWCFGTRRLYDRIDRNPLFSFQPIDKVCAAVAAQHLMVSITQVFSIDLTGQACADQFEGRLYGGIAAQPDFIRGAASTPGGKAIVCLASTTADGSSSRILPMLREGEGATLSRSDAHYVVTEFGIADLLGKSIEERALDLIEIAHPDHRGWLLAEAKRLGYLPGEQFISAAGAYPVEDERRFVLGGHTLVLRPARASDGDAMRRLFHSLSKDDVYTRFFSRLACLSFSDTQRLCNVDQASEFAFVVFDPIDGDRIVATASYYRTLGTPSAEVAYMIRPEWQGKGLGRVLQSLLFEHGKRHGIERFVAEILRTNGRMLKLAKSSCSEVDVERDGETLTVTMTP